MISGVMRYRNRLQRLCCGGANGISSAGPPLTIAIAELVDGTVCYRSTGISQSHGQALGSLQCETQWPDGSGTRPQNPPHDPYIFEEPVESEMRIGRAGTEFEMYPPPHFQEPLPARRARTEGDSNSPRSQPRKSPTVPLPRRARLRRICDGARYHRAKRRSLLYLARPASPSKAPQVLLIGTKICPAGGELPEPGNLRTTRTGVRRGQ
jgi:hypothetical protein